MDDLSNRDLSQVPDAELTPAEREELKRRLDGFVDVIRKRVIDGCHTTPKSGPDAKTKPADQGEDG